MAQRKGLINEIITSFLNSFKLLKDTSKVVGKDYMGTIYIEKALHQDGSMRQAKRWFVPSVKNDFEQEIPSEWQAWLRHRRKDPPTEEEIQRNLMRMKEVKKKVENLEKGKTEQKENITTSKKPSFPKYDTQFQIKPNAN